MMTVNPANFYDMDTIWKL